MMMTQFVAAVVIGGAFVVSGIAKLRDQAGTAETFQALGAPRWLDRRPVRFAYPWVELLLGAMVLFAPPGLWWPSVLFMLAMLAALLWFVGGVVRRAEAVSCNCFGTRQPVTSRTMWRNVLLLVLGMVAVLAGPGAALTWDQWRADPLIVLGVFFAVALVVAVAALSQGGHRIPAGAQTFKDSELIIPDLDLLNGDGDAVPVKSLVADGAALLIYLSHGCGACTELSEEFVDGQSIGGRVSVRLMEKMPDGGPASDRIRLWDDGGEVSHILGVRFAPAALLLAVDGTIPADPVYGPKEIRELVGALEEAVARAAGPDLDQIVS